MYIIVRTIIHKEYFHDKYRKFRLLGSSLKKKNKPQKKTQNLKITYLIIIMLPVTTARLLLLKSFWKVGFFLPKIRISYLSLNSEN